MTVGPEEFLPAELRGPDTVVTQLSGGLSGAGVFRVDAGGHSYVLKVSRAEEPIERWRGATDAWRLAAEQGLAPEVVAAEEARRSVLSAFVADRSFPAFYGNPQTRSAALTAVGELLRGVHALPVPDARPAHDPLNFLAKTWTELGADNAPSFVKEMVDAALLAQAPGEAGRAVLSHNDVNPGNLLFDGQRVLLVDWDNAGPNDPLFDVASIAVFLNLDADGCRRVLSAHDGVTVSELPARFTYWRRVTATMVGTSLLNIARRNGFSGRASEDVDSIPSLGEFYQRRRSEGLNLGSAEVQWMYGMSLLRSTRDIAS